MEELKIQKLKKCFLGDTNDFVLLTAPNPKTIFLEIDIFFLTGKLFLDSLNRSQSNSKNKNMNYLRGLEDFTSCKNIQRIFYFIVEGDTRL